MATKENTDDAFDIRVTRLRNGGLEPQRTYIRRDTRGRIQYLSGSGDPHALSNLVGTEAMELQIVLERMHCKLVPHNAVKAVVLAIKKKLPNHVDFDKLYTIELI